MSMVRFFSTVIQTNQHIQSLHTAPHSQKSTPPIEGVDPQEFAGHQRHRVAHNVIHSVLGEAGLCNISGCQDIAHADA